MSKININDVLDNIKNYNEEEYERVLKAYKIAEKAHFGQKRQSGEDYITHPVNVAYILTEMMADGATICAALLHDTIEDTDITKEFIVKEFNETVAILVDGVTKIKNMKFGSTEEQHAVNLHKLITGIKTDVRIIIIKLADRLHNMRTLGFKAGDKQKRIALETLKVYVPLADKIGAYRVKKELEDLALKYLEPDLYQLIETKRIDTYNELKIDLENMGKLVVKKLSEIGIEATSSIRIKNIHGIYKCIKNKIDFENIHDLLVVKIIVDKIPDCYLALWKVHESYLPLIKLTKDFICKPKTNLYQSLHTTVFGMNDWMVQFQIRTDEMDRIATFGLPAYWKRLKGKAASEMQQKVITEIPFYSYLENIENLSDNKKTFASLIDDELLAPSVYVRTRSGRMIELPEGSTPIDFAYKIDTHLGDYLEKAIVNEQEVALDYKLQNEDNVLIVTGDKLKKYDIEIITKLRTKLAKDRIKSMKD
ncbi:MAG: bifunctional (p)ppGpp synthetase/guanosine-3',5'-bis(diphosphate) 3'-pyrophosphohydrolase [Bacilli bacterium]|nr:bifunctional (p)ppGpp synthetase/guanosine-3',5'-bis(diphosphate) 3'-pyrophosphohydrolase [Bacilli bacterium]